MAKAKEIKLAKPKSDEICPPGYHVVRGHERTCHSGTGTWADAHVRRNRGSIPKILLSENIQYFYWGSKKKYPPLGKVEGFPENKEIDSAIQFWLDHWKDQGLVFPADLDPFLIKIMIAVESAFDPQAKSKVEGSSASGLMQITNQTRRILSGRPNTDGRREIRSDYLEISKTDIHDPVVAIAAGTRWFANKYDKVPKPAKKALHNTIKNYHSWDDQGEAYAKTVEALYKKSKKSR